MMNLKMEKAKRSEKILELWRVFHLFKVLGVPYYQEGHIECVGEVKKLKPQFLS
jgi:hypothetical protein